MADIRSMKVRYRLIENKDHLCGGRVNAIRGLDLMKTSSVSECGPVDFFEFEELLHDDGGNFFP